MGDLSVLGGQICLQLFLLIKAPDSSRMQQWLCYIPAVCLGESPLTSLGFSFLTSEMEIMKGSISW